RGSQTPPNREAKNGAQRPAPREPVIHDDQPADTHHRAPPQGEVVGDAKRTGESDHVTSLVLLSEAKNPCISPSGSCIDPSRLKAAQDDKLAYSFVRTSKASQIAD